MALDTTRDRSRRRELTALGDDLLPTCRLRWCEAWAAAGIRLPHGPATPFRITYMTGLPYELDLSGCGLGDDAVVALAAYPLLGCLQTLVLAGNEVGDRGADALAGSRHAARLRNLDVRDNPLSAAGSLALAGMRRLWRLVRPDGRVIRPARRTS